MAPPTNRRPGYSRRAQYSTFIGYVIAFAGALLGVGLLLWSARDASAFSGLRGLAADAAAPAAQVGAKGRTESQGFLAALRGYFAAGRKNAELTRELQVARVQLIEAAATREENARLKALLGLTDGEVRPVAVARLLGSSSASSRRFAMLGAGSAQGVQPGMPVRTPLGLIGRVLEVGRNSARVLLITDTESVVPVRRASDGVPAFATGRADGSIQLRLITLGVNPIKRGDAFVTSGSGGLYRPGIAMVVATRLTADGAMASPLADPGTTEFVAVEPIWEDAVAANAAAAAAGSTPTAAPAE